jgi:hypothetical protein
MFREHWMGISRTAVAAAVAVIVAAPALAQNTTAGIAGRVTGADGKPLAGASVTIVHVESRSTNTVATDADGRYGARGLRAGGPYTITITKDGLVDKREGVFLSLAETLRSTRLGIQAQTVVVTGRGEAATFNSGNMGAGTTAIGARELATFASIQRNLQDYARTDPRLAQTDKERGEISAAGQNTRYNSITIDGVTTNDTFGLESNNLPTAKQPISIDAIQSVQVNLSNYDVTQKGYTGANINAVTKSGTNEFKGSIYYVGATRTWRASATTAPPTPTSTRRQVQGNTKGFTLGGPIIKDKLFFFVATKSSRAQASWPDFGPVGSPLTNVGITTTAIDEAHGHRANTWGITWAPPPCPAAVHLSVKDTLVKLDWNISDAIAPACATPRPSRPSPSLGFSATGLSLELVLVQPGKSL